MAKALSNQIFIDFLERILIDPSPFFSSWESVSSVIYTKGIDRFGFFRIEQPLLLCQAVQQQELLRCSAVAFS